MRYPIAYFGSIPIALWLLLGAWIGGAGLFLLPFMAFVVVPFADRRIGRSRWPSDMALQAMGACKERFYDAALVTGGVTSLLVLAWGMSFAARHELSAWEFVGLSLSVGIVTGYIGIVAAHELIHRRHTAYRLLGWVLMSAVLYPHFCVEHIHGHHPRFATPEDHATARRGESLYAFILRSVFMGLGSAVRFRPAKVLGVYAVLALLLAANYHWLGPQVFAFTILQALFAVVLLEGVNYMEHYGLLRARLPNGQYEAPGPGHSWDTSSIITNVNTFNLGRHTQHHSAARRPYHRLQQIDAAPQLPYGYATMFLIALVPPLWFRIMDRKLDEWRAGAAARAAAG